MQGDKVGVRRRELGGVNGTEGAVEGVNRLDEVAGEVLQRKVFGSLDLALGALLEIAVVGDGAQVLVLGLGRQHRSAAMGFERRMAYLEIDDFLVFLLELLPQLRDVVLGGFLGTRGVALLLRIGWCSVGIAPQGRRHRSCDGGEGGS